MAFVDLQTKGRKSKKVDWIDCNHYSKWAHLDCSENWQNLHKNSWLSEALMGHAEKIVRDSLRNLL